MLTRLAAGVLAALIYAAPAAAGPVKSGQYDSPIGKKVTLNLAVAKSGKKIETFYLVVPTSCRVGKVRPHFPTTFSPTPDMVIKAGGQFGYTKIIRGPRPGAIQKWRLTGRFAPGGRSVSVTARYTLKRPDGGCDTKTRKATAPLTGLQNGGRPFTGPYAGRTAAGEPITFTVGSGRITNIETRATLKCDDGTTVVRDIRIDEVNADDSGFENDSIRGDFPDQFSVEGTLMPRDGTCSANEAFTATPARALDS